MNNVLERLLKWPWPTLGCSACGGGEAGSLDNVWNDGRSSVPKFNIRCRLRTLDFE
jgi:hypothetical protein